MIVLVGFMGAGKTTIGHILAEKLGIPFVDIDVLIERRAKTSIREIFTLHGEASFRRLEHETIVETLRGPDAVVALGGGAVEQPATRRVLDEATVVYLEVSYDEALLRIGHDSYRPMLDVPDVRGLYERRLPVYRQVATVGAPTNGRRPEAIVLDIITRVTTPPTVPDKTRSVLVAPAGGAYQVHIGPGLAANLPELLPPLPHAERAFVIAESVPDSALAQVSDGLAGRGLDVAVLQVPAGDKAKSFDVVETLSERLADGAAHRDDLIVGLGGEAVCDVAGFAAATYNRGMPVAFVPTSLLAQTDSAIGGKNAIHLPQGRNLVGTIHQPVVVICDVTMATRPDDRGFRSGLAEIIKHGLIADPNLLELLLARAGEVLDGHLDAVAEVMERSVGIKAAIVTADEREQGERLHLNYGHTFAHAIEYTRADEPSPHGEAVALGMMAAAHLARRLGRIGSDVVDAHRGVLDRFGLPTRAKLDVDQLRHAWLRDKKYRRGVRFVLLNALGQPEGAVPAPSETIAAALDDLAR